MGFLIKKDLPKLGISKSLGDLEKQQPNNNLMTIGKLSDEELVKLFQQGNEQAFQMLLNRHKKPVFNYLIKYMGQHQAAEEAFQEVFLRVLKSIEDYRPSAKFTTWIYKIARNYCIDYNRKQRFRNHLSLDESVDGEKDSLYNKLSDEEAGAEVQTSASELEKLLYQILSELNVEQREVFLLRETQGLQFDEIAKITKTSTNTVKSRMRYALQTIQKRFAEMGIDRDSIQLNASLS